MLSEIRLVGCQSWEDCTIKLRNNGLTVVAAPNNTGKSVLFKIFKIAVSPKYYPARKRKKLIRWGCAEAKAIFAFDNGDVACVVIQQTKTIYMWKPSGEESWQATYEPKREMIEALGFLVNDDGSFIANIIDADQKLLLVDSTASGTYEFIDMLCNNATLVEYKEKLTNLKNYADSDLTSAMLKLSDVERNLNAVAYVDVESLEQTLERVKSSKKVLAASLQEASSIQKLGESVQYSKDYKILEKILDVLDKIEAINLSDLRTEEFNTEAEKALDVLACMEDIELSKLQEYSYNDVEAELDVLTTLEQIDLSSLKTINEPIDTSLVDSLETIESLNEAIIDYQALQVTLNNTKSIIDNLTEEFINSGEKHECSIYGEVIFDGQKCVPVED